MSILEYLNIRYPIFLSPMAGVTTPELAASISNSGGLGSLALGANSVSEAREQILKLKELTSHSFQLNFFCHQKPLENMEINDQWIKYLTPHFLKFNVQPPEKLTCLYQSFIDNDDYLSLILEFMPKVVSFHFGIPSHRQIKLLKEAGIITMVTATNLEEALKIEEFGIDIIIAQGIEAGGHRGIFNPFHDSCLTTYELVKLLVENCRIPIVAAGGIMTGDDVKNYLDLGASAVQSGTAFIASNESNASNSYKRALFEKPITTQLTNTISGRLARGLCNGWHSKVNILNEEIVPPYPYSYDIGKKLHLAALENNSEEFAAYWAGTGVSQISSGPAKSIFQSLISKIKVDS